MSADRASVEVELANDVADYISTRNQVEIARLGLESLVRNIDDLIADRVEELLRRYKVRQAHAGSTKPSIS